MKYALLFHRNSLLVGFLILILFVWALSATYVAIRNRPQTTLIALKPDGAFVISEHEDRAGTKGDENFLRRFVALAFNYSNATYEENVSLATDLMSDDLFEAQKESLKKVLNALKTRSLVQSATVTSITRLEPEFYEIRVKTDQVIDQKNDSFETRVRVRLRETERTTRNPWGVEVTEFTYDRP